MDREILANQIRKSNASEVRRHIITSENKPRTGGEAILVCLSYFILLLTFPISVFFCIITATEFQRIVVFRLGRLKKGGARGPGLVFILPCVDEFVRVDLRTQSFDVQPQEILTKDSVTIQVDAVVYYRINNPLNAVIQIRNVREATQLLAQTTLRNVAGTKNLTELLTAKESLSRTIEKILDEATDEWGVKVERVEVKDVRLPSAMQRAMAAEAEALRDAKAKIISAEGELNASRALKEASDIMANNPITLQEVHLPEGMQRAMAVEQEAIRQAEAKTVAAQGELLAAGALSEASDVMKTNPIALQLRYLQTITKISNENNHTIILPFPLGIMRRFLKIAPKSA